MGDVYQYVLSVNGDKAGTVNFKGANQIASLDAAQGDKVVVSGEGNSLHITGDAFKLCNGATWEITDGAVISADNYLSLDSVNNGIAYESNMLVKDAAITVKRISSKGTKEGQHIGSGVFNVTFDNADVIVSDSKGIELQAQNSAAVNLTFKNSNVADINRICVDTAKGNVVFDNTNVTFKQTFRNKGTVTITNGSVINTALAFTTGEHYSANEGTLNITNGGKLYFNGAVFNNLGTITIADTTFTEVINNEGNVYLRGTVTVDADAFTGKAAVADTRAALYITDWEFSAENTVIANINAAVSQIKTINGQEVFVYGESAYFINTDGAIYSLAASGSQIVIANPDNLNVSATVAQKANSYEFTFTVTAAGNLGAVVYELTIGEETFTSTDGKFVWTNDAFASALADFTYSVKAVDAVGQEKVIGGTFAVTDYTAPVAEGFSFTNDGALVFTAKDNAGIASVKVNGVDVVENDGKYTFAAFGTSGTYLVEVTDANGFVSKYSGVVIKPVEKDESNNITVSGGTTDTQIEVELGDVKSEDTVGSLYISNNLDVAAGSISADADKSIEVVVGSSSNLSVDGGNADMTSVSDFASGSNVEIKANAYKGTASDDSFSLGMDGKAEFSSFDMLEGTDDVYVGVNAVLNVSGNMNDIEKLNIANGGSVNAANYYGSGLIKVGMNANFEAAVVDGVSEMTLGSKAAVAVEEITLNKLTVGSNAAFIAENLNGTAGNDVFTFSSNSESIVEDLAFGEGSDRLAMNSGSSLLIIGEVEGLERITGNKSCTIYTTDASQFSGITGSNLINIVEVDLNGLGFADICDELQNKDMDDYFKGQISSL